MKTEISPAESGSESLLVAENVTVERSREIGEKEVCLRRVSLEISRGEILALAGEQGAGTSIFCQLLAAGGVRGARVLSGRLWMGGEDLFQLRGRRRRSACRSGILYAGPDLMATFHPRRSVLRNLRDFIAARELPVETLTSASLHEKLYRVGCIEPEKFLHRKPEGLTSLELARLILLRVLLAGVRVFLCDGVLPALDPAARKQFLELIEDLQKEEGLAIVLTTGRLAGVDAFSDRVAVFFEGGILESGESRDVVRQPRFLYTREFLSCSPSLGDLPREREGISREAVSEAEEAIHAEMKTLDGDDSQVYHGE